MFNAESHTKGYSFQLNPFPTLPPLPPLAFPRVPFRSIHAASALLAFAVKGHHSELLFHLMTTIE